MLRPGCRVQVFIRVWTVTEPVGVLVRSRDGNDSKLASMEASDIQHFDDVRHHVSHNDSSATTSHKLLLLIP